MKSLSNIGIHSILITIDVEDWFQVENLRCAIPPSSWESKELRVERNINRILDLFDSISVEDARGIRKKECGKSDNGQRGTFFVLGWIAKRLPCLVREIHGRGHEIASHGMSHRLNNLSEDLKWESELIDSKKLLEDLTGSEVHGFRAPNFAIDHDKLAIIASCGYKYDSSYNSFSCHGRYGSLDLKESRRLGIAYEVYPEFFELPISNLSAGTKVIPWGGGGYFRLIPFFLFYMGVRMILAREETYLFFMHPWEIDAKQPRVDNIPFTYRFRHYVNQRRAFDKFSRLLFRSNSHDLMTCSAYLKEMKGI